jgi:magnesium-transporting ATPase (P-type)
MTNLRDIARRAIPDAEEVARLQARADRWSRISVFLSVVCLAVVVGARVFGRGASGGGWLVAIVLVVSGATGVVRLPHRVTMAVLTLCMVAMLGSCAALLVSVAR